jgi:D-alanyl-lipoteichoic acid acyltransferase DltB (MBOAT superfamily)
MLFNSYAFIFAFLPVTFAVFFAIGAWNRMAAAAWLAAASLFFYGWWNPAYVGLLLASILGNFFFGSRIAQAHASGHYRRSRILLAAAVTLNILLLGYFKYVGFFLETLQALSDANLTVVEIVLPLGISFFTFTQIAFLVDAYHGKAKEYNLVHYTLFVTYFPHLIAGPVLHHKEMMPQFQLASTYRIHAENIAVGSTIFFIGLFKKTVLADGIAPYVGPAFAASARGEALTFFDAWGGALAYTLQLYFDFSGYSDMAIGLSRLFGIRLPLNFDSPYKAVNIIDFWRRWHMTLSRFLRDYLYVPLGGNRRGALRRYVNLGITMVLGGLWHGAGWTYVAWGALHGFYLVVNHAWLAVRRRWMPPSKSSRWGTSVGRLVTLLAVIVGWVFFRAEHWAAALDMLQGMAGFNGVAMPAAILTRLGPLGSALEALGLDSYAGGGAQFVGMYGWIGVLMFIALVAPNTQQIMSKFDPALYETVPARSGRGPRVLRWAPNGKWVAVIALVSTAGILSLNRVSEFLYFQF